MLHNFKVSGIASKAEYMNTNLMKIDQLNVVPLLEGSASHTIAGLLITKENYDAAVDIINKQFSKSQQLISATHLSAH